MFYTLIDKVLTRIWPIVRPQRNKRRQSLRFKLRLDALEDRLAPAAPASIAWADWTSAETGLPGSAKATVTLANASTISVTYSGEVTFANTSTGTQYWTPTTTYTSKTYTNPPSSTDIIALTGGNTIVNMLTFSTPVTNPVFAIVSLGGSGFSASYNFNEPFSILGSGVGYWGSPGTLFQSPGNILIGAEGDGTIQFQGTYSSISWTVPTKEYWSGFTIGIPDAGHPPLALDDSYSTSKNVTLKVSAANGVLVNDSDPDSRVLSAVLAAGPRHGTLTFNPDGSFIYAPAPDYSGLDRFTYQDNDGLNGNVATVSLTINPQADSTQIDWADWTSATAGLPGSAKATLTVAKTSTISVTYSGEISFADTSGGPQYWAPASTYTSAAVANAPSSTDIIAVTGGNTIVDTLTFSSPVTDPVIGIVSLGWSRFVATYNFNEPFTILSFGPGYWGGPGTIQQAPGNVLTGTEGDGIVQFQGTYNSISWTVPIYENWSGFTVGIPDVAHPPIAQNDNYATVRNVPLTVSAANGVLANDNDPDGRQPSVVAVSGPTNGTLVFNSDGSFIYTPFPNYSGTDSFTYRHNDSLDAGVATVSLTINP
ncbi:MAG TPA: Ig-like domain-containing protein, partial [Gemmataceae bacterium]|nr:Ig-like domain-containing protein [Gemmataceae bacterium]